MGDILRKNVYDSIIDDLEDEVRPLVRNDVAFPGQRDELKAPH